MKPEEIEVVERTIKSVINQKFKTMLIILSMTLPFICVIIVAIVDDPAPKEEE